MTAYKGSLGGFRLDEFVWALWFLCRWKTFTWKRQLQELPHGNVWTWQFSLVTLLWIFSLQRFLLVEEFSKLARELRFGICRLSGFAWKLVGYERQLGVFRLGVRLGNSTWKRLLGKCRFEMLVCGLLRGKCSVWIFA